MTALLVVEDLLSVMEMMYKPSFTFIKMNLMRLSKTVLSGTMMVSGYRQAKVADNENSCSDSKIKCQQMSVNEMIKLN